VSRLPIDPALAAAVDDGRVEEYRGEKLDDMVRMLKGEKP
jgi:hypothetical protein